MLLLCIRRIYDVAMFRASFLMLKGNNRFYISNGSLMFRSVVFEIVAIVLVSSNFIVCSSQCCTELVLMLKYCAISSTILCVHYFFLYTPVCVTYIRSTAVGTVFHVFGDVSFW